MVTDFPETTDKFVKSSLRASAFRAKFCMLKVSLIPVAFILTILLALFVVVLLPNPLGALVPVTFDKSSAGNTYNPFPQPVVMPLMLFKFGA